MHRSRQKWLGSSPRVARGVSGPALRSIRWRAGVAWVAIFLLAFPLFVPLAVMNPAAVLALRSHETSVSSADHHGSAGQEQEYSDIPGAPGHPSDHDCAPCQILKYLASFIAQPELDLSSPNVPHTVASRDWTEQQYRYNVVFLPQSRAPPQLV